MDNTKLIKLLKSLSAKEFKDLYKFIISPYFNESKILVELYLVLKKYYPEFKNRNFTRENIFRAIYPDEGNYDDKKIRDRFSDMLKLCEEYISLIEIKSDDVKYQHLSLRQIAKRGLESHFESKYKEINTLIEKKRVMDNNFFLNRYEQVKDKRNFYEFRDPLGKRTVYYEQYKDEINWMNCYFIFKLLKYIVIQYNAKKHLNFEFDFTIEEPILILSNSIEINKYPPLELFKNIILLNNNFSDDLFDKTETLLNKSINIMEKDDARIIIIELYNFAEAQRRASVENYQLKALNLGKNMAEYGLYPIEGGFMAVDHFYNTIHVGLLAGDFDWVEYFTENFAAKLKPGEQENAGNYSNGMLSWKRNEHDSALDYFARVKTDDFYLRMRIKYNILNILFTQKAFETVLYEIDSFKHYLDSNDSIPDLLKLRAKNYLKILGQLSKAIINKNYNEISYLKNITEKFKPAEIEHREWLINSMNQIL